MNDTLAWMLAGSVAGAALLLMAASLDPRLAAQTREEASFAVAALEAPAPEEPIEALVAQALADAYFALARPDSAMSATLEDWYVRHHLTLKGLAARSGERPDPEAVHDRALEPAVRAPLSAAAEALATRRPLLDTGIGSLARRQLAELYAQAQAHYDWWLLAAEAGVPDTAIEDARIGFADAWSALDLALQDARIAAL